MNVYSLSPQQISEFYPFLRDMLVRACRGGGAHPVRLFEDGIRGDAIFWLALSKKTPTALIVTRIEEWPEGNVCRIVCASGRGMKDWLESALVTIERHAKENRCAKLVAEGRKGWGRALGASPSRYVFERRIAE